MYGDNYFHQYFKATLDIMVAYRLCLKGEGCGKSLSPESAPLFTELNSPLKPINAYKNTKVLSTREI